MQPAQLTVIELTGHIIDSLTLAKVIDTIQAHQCEYQINDIRIGREKNDFSTAQISLWDGDSAKLNALLEQLKTYGANPVEETDIETVTCQQDGILPPNGYIRFNPPMEVKHQGQWLPVAREGQDLTIVIEPSGKARLIQVSALKAGDRLVAGKNGVKVLPTVGEMAYA